MQARHRGRAGAGRHGAGCCEAARQPSTGTQAPHKPQNEINEQLCGDPWAVRLRRPGWHNDMYVLACTSLGAWPAGQRKVTSGTALTSGRSPSLGRASAKGPVRSTPPARPKTLCARAHAPLARPRGDAGAWVERARGHVGARGRPQGTQCGRHGQRTQAVHTSTPNEQPNQTLPDERPAAEDTSVRPRRHAHPLNFNSLSAGVPRMRPAAPPKRYYARPALCPPRPCFPWPSRLHMHCPTPHAKTHCRDAPPRASVPPRRSTTLAASPTLLRPPPPSPCARPRRRPLTRRQSCRSCTRRPAGRAPAAACPARSCPAHPARPGSRCCSRCPGRWRRRSWARRSGW